MVAVDDESVTLEHAGTKSAAIVGLDGIYSYFTDPSRTTPTQKCGFLQLLVQVGIAANGTVSVDMAVTCQVSYTLSVLTS